MKPSRTQQALIGLGVLFVIMATLLGGLIVALAERALPDVRLLPTASCMPTVSCPPTWSLTQIASLPDRTDAPTRTATSIPGPTRRPTRTIVPTQSPVVIQTLTQTSCDVVEGWVPYQIQPGDTLFLIGMRYGARVDTLLEANCLDSTLIHTGDIIYVPPVTPHLPSTQAQPATTSLTPDPTVPDAIDKSTASATVEPTASVTDDPPTSVPAGPAAVATLTATDGACTDLNSVITSPYVGALLFGTIEIAGTAQMTNFASYRLEIRQEGTQQSFTTIFTGYEPVANGILAEFNTLEWPNGEYWLRLVVLDDQNHYPERCSILIAFYNCDCMESQ